MKVFLANEEITCGVARASLALGYCPQVDALWPEITLKEHLRTYAWIKGVPREATSQMITRFDLPLRCVVYMYSTKLVVLQVCRNLEGYRTH